MTTKTAEACPACGFPMVEVRRSRAWDVGVARCTRCHSLSVVDASSVVDHDLAQVAATQETNWDIYGDAMHTAEDVRNEILAELRARVPAVRRARPEIFDVGAGTGGFLDMARSQGFGIQGNDISRSAIDFARAKYGIELSDRGLDEQPAGSVDAVTMWCVLAHVGDPRAFLADARDMLAPGGVLFLRTPRLCSVDSAAQTIARRSGERVALLADQRVTRGHLHLFSDDGMRRMLDGLGFVDIDVRPVVHSGCTGSEIASRLGTPSRAHGLVSRAIDKGLQARIAPRSTMFVYARKAD